MNKILKLLIGTIIMTGGYWMSAHAETKKSIHPELHKFLDAIREVETGGLPNGGLGAKGDKGKSYGPYQIQKAYWQDSRLPGGWEQVLNDKEYSEQVMIQYFQRYERKALEAGDWETLARLHNSGPNWRKKKKATQEYWDKVSIIMIRNSRKR